MNQIKVAAAILRYLPICFGVNWKDTIAQKDLARWQNHYHIQNRPWISLAILLYCYPEYRNLFIYRNRNRRIFRVWVALWYRPMNTLYLEAKEIGGGLYIQHGFATMVSAERIGENCWINQQVTIGFSNKGDRAPIIGDNVMITCGAKVLGPITVGDNAVIGANAVVIKDVEPGAVMGGVPARRLK